jgi:hypothetical protein
MEDRRMAQLEMNTMRRNQNRERINKHRNDVIAANVMSRDNLKEQIKNGITMKFKNSYMDQQVKNYKAGHLYTQRKNAQNKARFDKDMYN